MSTTNLVPRDPIKPASYYLRIAGLYESEIGPAIKLNSSAVLCYIADTHLRVARALYSGGASAPDCQTHLAKAATYFTEYLSASMMQPLHGIPDTESFLENMSAAFLSGAIGPCVQALRAARIEHVPRWQEAILSLIANVYEGKGELPENIDSHAAHKEYGQLFTVMFLAVLRRDHLAFPDALEAYLRHSWGPSADRAARGDLRARPPAYVGKWAFHAVALCKLMGGVPPLSKKAMQYVPADLIRE